MQRKKISRLLVQCVFIYLGLQFLSDTASFFNVYYLCAFVSIICFCKQDKSTELYNKRHKKWLNILSLFFSLLIVLANYDTILKLSFHSAYIPRIFDICGFAIVLMGGFIVARNIICYLYDYVPHRKLIIKRDVSTKKGLLFCFGCMSVFLVIDFTYLIFVAYPGILTPDSMIQMQEVLYGFHSNHHPFWHTAIIYFCFKIGMLLFNNINAAVCCYSVFSVIFIAGCFTYALFTVYQTGIPEKVIIGCLLLLALLPYNITYSVTMWKDVFFGGAALVLIVTFYRLLFHVGRYQVVNQFVLFFSGVAFCVWRSNGLPACILTVFILAVFLSGYLKKTGIIPIMTASVIVSWIMCNPVLSSLGIQQPDFVESLSIPVQQVARVIADDCSLTLEQEEILAQIVPDLSEVSKCYNKGVSDPIKNLIREHPQYLDNHKKECLKLWIQLGVQHPKEYVYAWIDQTKGYWNGGYDYWFISQGIEKNSLGIYSHPFDSAISKFLKLYVDVGKYSQLLTPLHSIGLHVWILLIVFAVFGIYRKKESILCIPVIAVICTLLIATPVYCEFRYIYSLFTSLPFILLVSFYSTEEDTLLE